jgi:hypothetical protein
MTIAWKKWYKAAGTLRHVSQKQQENQLVKQEIILKDGLTTKSVIDEENDEMHIPQEIADTLSDNIQFGETVVTRYHQHNFPVRLIWKILNWDLKSKAICK